MSVQPINHQRVAMARSMVAHMRMIGGQIRVVVLDLDRIMRGPKPDHRDHRNRAKGCQTKGCGGQVEGRAKPASQRIGQ